MGDTTSDKDDALLRELADREAIRNLVNLYAHHVWRKDVKAVVDLFAEDGEMDTLTRPLIRGRHELLVAYQEMLAEDEFQPFVHNHVMELNGDLATGTCYIDLRAVVEGRRLMGWGHYDDRYVRVAGDWKFEYRKVNISTFAPVGRRHGRDAGSEED